MLELVAVVRAQAATEACTAGHPWSAEVMTRGPVAMVFRRTGSAPPSDREHVLEFGQRLQGLASASAVLPVRYGTLVDGPDELAHLLEERGEGWARRLDELDGAVEVVLRASAPEPAEPNPGPAGGPRTGPGRAYLERLAGAERRRTALAEEVRAAVAGHCREVRVLRADEGIRFACLVQADRVGSLTRALEDWRNAAIGRQALVTGPFPVLSFAEAGEPSA